MEGKLDVGVVMLEVLVLGGTSGIGFAVAEAALEHGATVIISARDRTR